MCAKFEVIAFAINYKLMKDSTETNRALSPAVTWCTSEPKQPALTTSQKDTATSIDCLDDEQDFES